ncbi:Putative manganese exporter [Sporomusa carbonis]|uniref:TMEM165/GDT1 family protein n=1 Tax=Sporomusa carbonis TaxID=3076075 RepID=UPI003A74DD9A
MEAFLTSLIFVVLAEMGDKTQLLGMCFATRYRWQTVLWGVFVATVLNHLFAVEVGNYLTRFVPISYIQIAAAVSFIIFGLWTIRGDELDESCANAKYSPFWTVAIAFFMAEMGDKTQLATVALAAKFNTVIPVWLGTTVGMMIANAIGIIIGVTLGKRIPERLVKWISAAIFIFFGFVGLYQNLPEKFLTMPFMIGAVVVVALCAYYLVKLEKKPELAKE